MGSAPQGTLELVDDNFEVLEATQIHVHGGKGTISDSYGITLPAVDFGSKKLTEHLAKPRDYLFCDPRLALLQDDTIAFGFMPYSLQSSEFGRKDKDSWWDHEVFTTLHVGTYTAGNETR